MKPLLALATAAAGFLVAVLLTFPAVAAAWDWQALPDGYGASSYATICDATLDQCQNGETCNHVTIRAPGTGRDNFAETDCVNPTFQRDLDAYIDSTICTANPAAGQARGMCLPTTTATSDSGTTTAVTTDTTPVTTTTAPADTTTPTATTVAAAPVVTQTVTVVTVLVDPSINDRLSLLEQRQAVDEARIAALENPATAGTPIGEPKNVAPFVSTS